MASLPGMNGDVFYGDVDTPVPNWRTESNYSDDDDDELTPEQREALVGVLGFDPAKEAAVDEQPVTFRRRPQAGGSNAPATAPPR